MLIKLYRLDTKRNLHNKNQQGMIDPLLSTTQNTIVGLVSFMHAIVVELKKFGTIHLTLKKPTSNFITSLAAAWEQIELR